MLNFTSKSTINLYIKPIFYCNIFFLENFFGITQEESLSDNKNKTDSVITSQPINILTTSEKIIR